MSLLACEQLHKSFGGLIAVNKVNLNVEKGEMVGLTDRIRLRPLTVGEKDDMLFLSSEESAIRLICPDLDKAWIPAGGQPIVGRLAEPTKPQPIAAGEEIALKC